ncbi:hypothetical protein [Shewanella sp. FJAT-52076]|uniref:hypothetical protein n=1 Tax=Shewanella sp. FJAT-52076 TaxID=2864202 RepID=UPI001C65EA13|nr:hypothetical protein [Shewanella sp. FJAT-52076]QYJ75860.1 hypothetical protein K0H79_02395 [Shewanella sp. FJAT-52076]
MLPQREAEGELIGIYRRMLAVIVMLLLLAVVGFRYFSGLESVASHSMVMEQGRLQNLVSMARSKWLGQGRGEILKLEWELLDRDTPAAPVLIHMSAVGWPQPPQRDAIGCRALWQQLLGYGTEDLIDVSFDTGSGSCQYLGEAHSLISYHLDTGKVTLVNHTN